jgi:sulfite dehydrogenase (cytochrome) subunit B
MKIPRKILVIARIAALPTVTASLFAADSWKLPPETVKLKPGPGVELATGQCLLCHSADYIGTQPRLTRAGWEASVKKMKEKYGAPIPADKTAALVDYLVANYGKADPAPAAK